MADNYKQWFTLLLSRAWRRLALLGGRTENSLTGGVPHRSVGPPFLIRTRRLPGSTRVCYAVRALLGVARAGRCRSSDSRQLRAIVAALGLWPGRSPGKDGVLVVAPAGRATDSITYSQVVQMSWPPTPASGVSAMGAPPSSVDRCHGCRRFC